MKKENVRALIEETGLLPAIRVPSADDAMFAAGAIFRGGIPVMELTMTVPGAIEVLSDLSRRFPEIIIGAGTVLNRDTALRCIDAGAAFLTSPGLDTDIVELAVGNNVLAIPGALSPTEVVRAHKAGADFVKIFPCSHVGGPAYIKALKAPFPRIPLIASGGVTQLTARDFIAAGAAALGIREDLIPNQAVEHRNESWIHELIHRFVGIVRNMREGMVA